MFYTQLMKPNEKSSITLPTISQKEFLKRLEKRGENLNIIRKIDEILLEERGYIFKMPPPGSSVISLFSGGIDSTVLWACLVHKYKLKVYPLLLDRGAKRKQREERAVKFFSEFFAKNYPKLYVKPFHLSTHLPPPELTLSKNTDIHPQIILDHLNLSNMSSTYYSTGILPYSFPFYAVAYATYLRDVFNTHIKTIFCGVGANDGIHVPSQTQTALRSTTLALCTGHGDYDWNFASLFFEKELGHWLDKKEIIQLGNKLNLPLEKTWSCYQHYRYQCGDKCQTCWDRTQAFKEAKVIDETVYLKDKVKWKQNIIKFLGQYL